MTKKEIVETMKKAIRSNDMKIIETLAATIEKETNVKAKPTNTVKKVVEKVMRESVLLKNADHYFIAHETPEVAYYSDGYTLIKTSEYKTFLTDNAEKIKRKKEKFNRDPFNRRTEIETLDRFIEGSSLNDCVVNLKDYIAEYEEFKKENPTAKRIVYCFQVNGKFYKFNAEYLKNLVTLNPVVKVNSKNYNNGVYTRTENTEMFVMPVRVGKNETVGFTVQES